MVDDNLRPLDDVLDGLRFAMVTTESPGGLTARPLTLMEQDGATLRFLVSQSADWVQDVADVQVSFADPHANRYVALTGIATLSVDRAELERLWNPMAKAFFDGPDDPDLGALEVEVRGGEWWDGPSGRIGQGVAMLRAVVTGDEGKAGSSGAVSPGR
jgi:general stress protein 26